MMLLPDVVASAPATSSVIFFSVFIFISGVNSPFLWKLNGRPGQGGGAWLGWVCIACLMGADEQGGVQVQAEGRVQRLRERAAKGVQKQHCVRHAVEGQRSFLALQEHADSGAGRRGHRGLAVVVPGSIPGVRAPQPPRVLVAAQQAGFATTFAPDTAVGDADVDPSAAPPLHLPVAGTTKLALPAQDLGY